jgi:RNA polymerase sigma-70 factor, ECF subfamily
MQQDLKVIIQQCRLNDPKAFRHLVEMHQGMVFTMAFRLICNEDEAKDVVQETFIRVWKNFDKYNAEMKFTTWLFTIATRLCYDRLKSSRWRKVQSLDSVKKIFEFQTFENTETSAINSDLAAAIKTLTDKLTPRQKLVFTLRDLECLDVEEVEHITGLSAAKIKSNLYLARQFIRQELERM